ncbi:Magnesium and cobalt efflux protein CorC [Polystyrenella longa]|uniref:Magnesium and cobalt efflux protein CorC n=1 Tax=Polystyrenella longa TaxID=2528007 RepID=A0A518CQ39_9PLAN|nr:hemolysin family protein [Polystyrenella longa]QDU81339.1 Magnesium and cobalt efflux protein CorC [Polystyrenella longa]
MSLFYWSALLTCWGIAAFWLLMVRYTLHDFSRSRLEAICEKKNKTSRFGDILKKQDQVLILVDLVLLLASFFALSLFNQSNFFSSMGKETASDTALWITELVLVFLGLFLGLIIIPWSTARVAGEIILYHSWTILGPMLVLGKPFVLFAESANKLIHRLAGQQEPAQSDSETIAEELQSVIDEGQREGVLEDNAGTMMYRVMEMAEQDTSSIMTPRTDMDCIHVDGSLEETRRQVVEAGHSRIPIIGDSTDDIIGILYAKDLLKVTPEKADRFSLKKLVRQPLYVPETTGINTLLETMKKERIHIAIVVDEYGGVAGLVCMEDILEEIVGEIDDEYDEEEASGFEIISETVVELDPRLHIDDVNEQFGYKIPEEGDYDTIGGFILTILNRVPTQNEVLSWNHLQFTILEVDQRKINKVRIEVSQHHPELPVD